MNTNKLQNATKREFNRDSNNITNDSFVPISFFPANKPNTSEWLQLKNRSNVQIADHSFGS